MKTQDICNLGLSLLLLLFFLTLPGPAVAQLAPPSDFEALAGQIGRAEAWYRFPRSHADPDLDRSRESLILDGGWAGQRLVEEGEAMESRPHAAMAPSGSLTPTVYLPLIRSAAPLRVERRAIWVTRYDWTTLTGAPAPADIDRMVAQIAAAGFNTIFSYSGLASHDAWEALASGPYRTPAVLP
jgi:hypothetical protein